MLPLCETAYRIDCAAVYLWYLSVLFEHSHYLL